VVDTHHPAEAVALVAEALERQISALGCGFPVRVFGLPRGYCFRSEQEYLDGDAEWFRSFQPPGAPFSDAELKEAMKETYLTINLQAAER
jgi:hypothetical protein